MLIEIEGVRGAGKSTLIAALCGAGRPGVRFVNAAAAEEELADSGWSLGAFMRGLDEPVPAPESLFLYCARTAARARLISTLRTPPGVPVLSDRLSLSLYVQARLAGLAGAEAWALVRLALQDVTPDCTVLLDADYQSHLERLKGDGRVPQADPDFQAHRDAFAQAFRTTETTKIRIDTAGMAAGQVRASVLAALPLAREPECGASSLPAATG